MVTVYRGPGAWGSGKGSPLTKLEVDTNFYGHETRIAAIEGDMPAALRGIDSIDIDGDVITFTMSDATTETVTVPAVTYPYRGAWTPSTSYTIRDHFTNNGNLYEVAFSHVSGLTFSAGANNGLGDHYYDLILSNPAGGMPTGGAVGQVMSKSTTADYAVTWSYKLPTGGTNRQYLIKQSSTTQDALWGTPLATDISFTASVGSDLVSTTVAAALEELEDAVADAASVTFTPVTGSDLTADDVAEALEELSDTKANIADLLGRQTIWIPATAMTPRTTNGAATGSAEMSSNKNMVKTLDFDPSTQEFAQFDVPMPKSWNNGAVYFVPYWSHAATTTNFGVVFGMDAVAISNDDTLDVAFGTAQTSTDTGGTTNDLYVGPESVAFMPAGSPANADLVQFRIHRDPANGSDTLAVDARLHGVMICYITDALTDD